MPVDAVAPSAAVDASCACPLIYSVCLSVTVCVSSDFSAFSRSVVMTDGLTDCE